MNLTKEQRGMIREAARGIIGLPIMGGKRVAVEGFEAAVIRRLQKLADGGVTITTPNVAAACSQELARGK